MQCSSVLSHATCRVNLRGCPRVFAEPPRFAEPPDALEACAEPMHRSPMLLSEREQLQSFISFQLSRLRPGCVQSLSMGACFSSAAGLESTSSQPLLRGTEPQQYRLAKNAVVPQRASQPAQTPVMAAAVDRTTLVPGETVTDLVTRFKALIAKETDPTKKAAMEAQLKEKEEAIRNKRYR